MQGATGDPWAFQLTPRSVCKHGLGYGVARPTAVERGTTHKLQIESCGNNHSSSPDIVTSECKEMRKAKTNMGRASLQDRLCVVNTVHRLVSSADTGGGALALQRSLYSLKMARLVQGHTAGQFRGHTHSPGSLHLCSRKPAVGVRGWTGEPHWPMQGRARDLVFGQEMPFPAHLATSKLLAKRPQRNRRCP